MAFWFRVLTGGDDSDEDGAEPSVSEEEQDEYVTGFTYKLVTWGSEDFLIAYVVFKEKMKAGDAMLEFERVLFALRRDLGYSNKDLNEGDLLRVFLSGVDDLLVLRLTTVQSASQLSG